MYIQLVSDGTCAGWTGGGGVIPEQTQPSTSTHRDERTNKQTNNHPISPITNTTRDQPLAILNQYP